MIDFWESPLVVKTLSIPELDDEGNEYSIITADVPFEAWSYPLKPQRASILCGSITMWGTVELLSDEPYLLKPPIPVTMRFVYAPQNAMPIATA